MNANDAAATPQTETITVLVLGPMRQVQGGHIEVEDRTAGLKVLIEKITKDLEPDANTANRKVVMMAPENRTRATIVPGVLDLIENAHLVILDLTGNRANVTYEAGIVHALGVPCIILTSDAQPPFYFIGADYIGHFHYAQVFDPDQVTHRDLHGYLRRFIADPTLFSDNQLTAYFELPIVDIAGPSGLAAGYYRNSIRRFVRRHGFVASTREVVWPGRLEVKDGIETRRPEIRPMTVAHYIAVRPPGNLRQSSGHAGQLADILKGRGLRTEFAALRKLPDDYADMRDFVGQFLVRDTPRDQPVAFIQPGVIVEIPTTLYALPFSPRVAKRLGLAPAARAVAEARLFAQMQASFERNLDFLLHKDPEVEEAGLFRWTDLADLPKLLDELGVG
jgi:nucleoside 2-deoxyribosyltransferase